MRYGKALTPQLVEQIVLVTRVDPNGEFLEVEHADGRRLKIPKKDCRPALHGECEIFKQWRSNRGCIPKPGLSQSLERKRGREPDAEGGAKVPAVWWAIPKLVVRCVNAEFPAALGQNFRVDAAVRKANEVIARPIVPCSDGSLNITFRQEDIETVVPRVGERGIVVLGPHRGEIVTVIERENDGHRRDCRSVCIRFDDGAVDSLDAAQICATTF